MNSFFSLFGKLAFGALIIGLLVGGGYYLGKGKFTFPALVPSTAVTTTVIESSTPTGMTTPIALPSSTAQTKTTITAGVTSGLSFSMYTIDVPTSWVVTREQQTTPTPMDTLTLTKGDYKINIFQGAMGGAMCFYSGEPTPTGEVPTSTFGPYVTIHDGNGKEYRRAKPITSTGYTLCQNTQYGWNQPTAYGSISYSTPASPNEVTIQEMDAIIATLKKKI